MGELQENVCLKVLDFIDWYELDPEVVEVCNKHLGEHWKKINRKKFS